MIDVKFVNRGYNEITFKPEIYVEAVFDFTLYLEKYVSAEEFLDALFTDITLKEKKLKRIFYE